jgi:hypothetical protein
MMLISRGCSRPDLGPAATSTSSLEGCRGRQDKDGRAVYILTLEVPQAMPLNPSPVTHWH